MTRGAIASILLLAAGLLLTPACSPYEQVDFSDQLNACRDDRADLQRRNKELAEQVKTLEGRVERLQQIGGPQRIELLYPVSAIDIDDTAAVDTDDIDGDDAVKVMLRPMDAHGSVLKRAGRVRVRLFDLAAEEAETLLHECVWTPEELGKNWYGGFGVYQFSLTCPLKKRPSQKEVTVRVTYTDYLSGKEFSKQAVVQVNPGDETATQPTD
jgi:hypothetical protein